jgi:hypothetical protein
MPWIPDEHMADVHVIRQDYAQARAEAEADPDDEVAAAHYAEQYARRARAMRSLHRDDAVGVRHLAAMFRCSKAMVRAALEEETDE